MKEELRKFGLFSDLADPDLDRVARRLKRHRFDAGAPIIRENEPSGRCHLILSGAVRITSSVTDKPEHYATLNAGDHFGEISLIDGLPPSASVVADEPTETLSISHDDLRTLLETEPKLAASILMSMLRALCGRLRETDQSLAFTRLLMREGGR